MFTRRIHGQEAEDSPGTREVVRLRHWGTGHTYRLPTETLRCSLGSDTACAVRIEDPSIFALHAQLVRARRRWRICALGDPPGLLRDGMRCPVFALEPGVEIGIGAVTLVAESVQWIELREFCARLLGWDGSRMAQVDRALRAIRMSLSHRSPLILCGEGDLVPLARSLHHRLLGPSRPFVLADPRRNTGRASVRSPMNRPTGAVAMQAAVGGTLCIRAERPPEDFAFVMARARQPDARFQLVLCSGKDDDGFLPSVVPIPPLDSRVAELPRIVDAYAAEAVLALEVPIASFTEADRAWVLAHGTTSLPEIEKATLRLVALRTSASIDVAADRLGMATVSLSRWIGRRSIPGSA